MVLVFQLAHMEKNSKENGIIQTLVQPAGEPQCDRSRGKCAGILNKLSGSGLVMHL